VDPDEQEFHRQQALAHHQRLARLDQVKQSVQPFVQAAHAGTFGIAPDAGKALLDAIHYCQDGLDMAWNEVSTIQQQVKLGTSPDALVMIEFNQQVGTDAATALNGLREILAQAENGVAEAMKHYRRMDDDGASVINQTGS
jgi:hypothetical protein